MAKINKADYTKDQFRKLKEQRKIEKAAKRAAKSSPIVPRQPAVSPTDSQTSFVLGNGLSRTPIKLDNLKSYGKVYGCNALYREYDPDYLVAVDVKMVLELNKNKYQQKNSEVWTNPNKAYSNMSNFNFFQPSKGWSSGPTALWLASQHGYETIYILGFDYRGLKEGKAFNNLYADSANYKKSEDGATFFGNWLRQTKSVIQSHKKIQYVRVIAPDNYEPDELNKFSNFSTITVDTFKKIHSL